MDVFHTLSYCFLQFSAGAFLAGLATGAALGQVLHDGQVYVPPATAASPREGGDAAARDYIGIYQRFLSPLRGSRCAMFPSCSNYGLDAFRSRPFPVAMALTADRMLRCGHDGKYYGRTYEYGYPSLVDFLPGKPVPPHLVAGSGRAVSADRFPCHVAADSTLDFIRLLLNRRSYASALLEAERVAYFHPELADSSLWLLRLKAYDGLGREEEAIFDYVTHASCPGWGSAEIRLQVAKMYHEIGNYAEAVAVLDGIAPADSAMRGRVLLCGAVSALAMGDEAVARLRLEQARPFMEVAAWEASSRVLDGFSKKRPKRPWLAGVLSVVPGGGYFYNRQPASALTSLLVNGLLAYATYNSIDRKNYGVAGLMGVFSLTFYAGNFIGAVNGVKRYNTWRSVMASKRLEELNVPYY